MLFRSVRQEHGSSRVGCLFCEAYELRPSCREPKAVKDFVFFSFLLFGFHFASNPTCPMTDLESIGHSNSPDGSIGILLTGTG